MKSITTLILILFSLNYNCQTWQFVKPYHELTNEYELGEVKQLKSGNLIRSFSDTYRTHLQGYNRFGDSLWYQKIEKLYISELLPVGDSVYFVGWFTNTITLNNSQTYTCGDSIHGIYGLIDVNGIFKNVKTLQGGKVWLKSVALQQNTVCIGGAFGEIVYTPTTTFLDSIGKQGLLLTFDKNLNFQKCAKAYGETIILKNRIDNLGNIYILASASYFVLWGNRYLSHPDSGYCTTGGQVLFKISPDLKFIWKQNIYAGIGPGYFMPSLFLDGMNRPSLIEFNHWGSGAGTFTAIHKYNTTGTPYWTKSFSSSNPILGQDSNDNLYTISTKTVFTLYKVSSSGTILYSKDESPWPHSIRSWEFVGEDSFYGLGECSSTYFNCIPNRKLLTYYGTEKLAGIDNINNFNERIIYPNPAQNKIQFKGIQPSEMIRVFDINGFYSSEISVNSEGQADISHLQSGIYIVVVKSANSSYVLKLIKQ